MPKGTVKSFHCQCLEKMEKDQKVTARISVAVTMKTKEGWDMKRSVGIGDGLNYCPICGRILSKVKEGK